MHRRWMSLPLLSTCVSAFYPYSDGDGSPSDNAKRFVPYQHSDAKDNVASGTSFTVDLRRLPRRDNKFSVVLSNKVAAPNSLPIDQDGSDFSYFSSMQFGSKGQPMYMLIDTGSGNTWVMGEDCKSKSCGVHNLFGKDDSQTLNTTNNTWSVSYGTGRVSGNVATDTVKFANFTLDLGFGLATTASDDFLNYPMDGLLGLGRAPSNQLGVPSFMEALGTQGGLKSNVAGVRLHRASDGSKDGEITFGGIDTSKVDGDITYTKTSKNDTWTLSVDDFYVSDQAVKLVGKGAMLDTGSSYILMPANDASAIHALVPGSAHNGEEFTVPCNTKASMQVSFSGKKWSIASSDWVRKPSNASATTCASNIIGHQPFGPNDWILGAVFLKNVYSVFDFDQGAIGLAKLSASATMPAPSASSTTASSPSATGSNGSPTQSNESASPSQTAASGGSVGNPFDLGGTERHTSAAVSALRPGSTSWLRFQTLLIIFAFLLGIWV